MKNKFYIVPEVVLDMLQENFKHSHFKSVQENDISKGKVEVLELLKKQVHSIDIEGMLGPRDAEHDEVATVIREAVLTMPSEFYVTINGSSETCRSLFEFLKQNGYSGNFERLIEEAVFLINIHDKTAKSFADTKEPVYTLEHLKVIHQLFGD